MSWKSCICWVGLTWVTPQVTHNTVERFCENINVLRLLDNFNGIAFPAFPLQHDLENTWNYFIYACTGVLRSKTYRKRYRHEAHPLHRRLASFVIFQYADFTIPAVVITTSATPTASEISNAREKYLK